MLGEPPSDAPARRSPDLLVVGGLTIDRFTDGSTAPGGSPVHAARAMHMDGRKVAVATTAGPEPEASAGLSQLRSTAEVVVMPAEQTICFQHAEVDGRRELTPVAVAAPIRLGRLAHAPRAVLYAPVAGELDAGLGGQVYRDAPAGAVLQGWLRELRPGHPARPLPLGALEASVVRTLGELDMLVASVDDLAAEASTSPHALLGVMRQAFGPTPILVLTAGVEGSWLDLPSGELHHVPVPRRVDGVSTVGAGDAFAASMVAAMARGLDPRAAAAEAANLAAELLAQRTGRRLVFTGDVHGMLGPLFDVLRGADLLDAEGSWRGGRDELWLTGDLVDRGPDGIGVIDLVMRLEHEAHAAGGRVGCVLGNHELMLLAARELPDQPLDGGRPRPSATTFRDVWEANGGHQVDLDRLTDAHAAWLRNLPVAVRVGPALLVHADALLYGGLGSSVEIANAAVRVGLAQPRPAEWGSLVVDFSQRRAFRGNPGAARALLDAWGGREVVHGHTHVRHLVGDGAGPFDAGVRYADGMAVAVDGGVHAGGSPLLHVIRGS